QERDTEQSEPDRPRAHAEAVKRPNGEDVLEDALRAGHQQRRSRDGTQEGALTQQAQRRRSTLARQSLQVGAAALGKLEPYEQKSGDAEAYGQQSRPHEVRGDGLIAGQRA